MLPVAPDDLEGPPEPDGRRPRRRLVAVLVLAVLLLAGLGVYELVRPAGRPGPPAGSRTLTPYEGLGAWVDAYDWTIELGGAEPSVGLDDIDAMADAGVQTLFIQTTHRRSVAVVMEPDRLDELIDRAHRHDMHVVAWYLPTFVDVDADLERLLAASALRVDGLGVDIESTDGVPDPVERNARLLDLSQRLRAAVPAEEVLSAITLSAVHVGVVNPAFWPGYPYAQLAESYDAIVPMAYWTIRKAEYDDGLRYVSENIARIRAAVGLDVAIHVVGGIADRATVEDLAGMLTAVQDGRAIGGSLYDWATSRPEQWKALAELRSLRSEPED